MGTYLGILQTEHVQVGLTAEATDVHTFGEENKYEVRLPEGTQEELTTPNKWRVYTASCDRTHRALVQHLEDDSGT